MPSYRLFETAVFIKDLSKLPPGAGLSLREKLMRTVYPRLKAQPYYGPNLKKLRDWDPETRRYRLGPWRIFYEVDEDSKVVYLLTLSLRRDAY
ncbi:MAG: type II toxin-antitoxin system RelE/ParE family toxin [Elusimicrobiota bacterium]